MIGRAFEWVVRRVQRALLYYWLSVATLRQVMGRLYYLRDFPGWVVDELAGIIPTDVAIDPSDDFDAMVLEARREQSLRLRRAAIGDGAATKKPADN